MDDIDIKFNMSANENDPISNHYFLQLKNLVVKKSNFIIQINRILQIAFNVGQLSIFIENNKLDMDRRDEISRFIYMNDMLNVDTYVSIDKQKEIDKLLDDHLVHSIISKSSLKDLQNLRDLQNGGNNIYYQKYMKYKIKYNNLKKYS